MFCKNCGASIETSSKFCHSCGNSRFDTGDERKSRSWLKIFTFLIVLLLILLFWLYYSIPDLASSVEGQLTALKENKISEAYYEYTSKEFQTSTNLDAFREFVKSNPILLDAESLTIEEQKIDNTVGILKGILTGSKDETAAFQFFLINENEKWKIRKIEVSPAIQKISFDEKNILSLAEALPVNQPDTAVGETKKTYIPVVEHFLKSLKANKIEDSYTDVAPEFKTATSISQFETYLKSTPILSQFSNYSISQAISKDDDALVKMILDPSKGAIPVEFHLSKKDGEWKIWSFRVILPTKEGSPAEVLSHGSDDMNSVTEKELEGILNDQIKAIQEKELDKAYNDYTSQGFKETTTLDEFKKFIEIHPYLSAHKQMKLNLTFETNIPVLKGTITSEDQHSYSIEYRFVKENEVWKLLHIDTSPENGEKEKAVLGKMEFTKVMIGRKIDNDGLVKDPQTSLKADSNDVYVNLYVKNGIQGEKIELKLEHLPSNSTTPPISTVLNAKGDSIISFIFSAPPQGWPKGPYQVIAKGSSGIFQTYLMKMD